ncbi:molybdopterin converting factor subunit 1 [Gammaproteobacteria bacterium]|nr:molybdopterin converting factor subunit 1 [Gammaproteobacteria bacterium]
MTVKIVLFANLREALGVDSVELQITGSSSVSALISQLADQQSQEWFEMLTAENIRVAVNQDLINEDVDIVDGDEVAFFPPVTGG